MDPSPELDQLFVAAALQLGFVSQAEVERLVGEDPSGDLSERLQQRGLLAPPDVEAIRRVVDRQLARCNGDSRRAAEAIEPATRDLLDGYQTTVSPPPTTAHEPDPFATSEAAPRDAAAPQSRRFTILRQHQQGGLGMVSVAKDADFNREVAFKEILPAAADDQHNRRRFLREAEITGALEHPGVVPVYALGQYEDGRPYYAMRFIHGADLQQEIEAFKRLPESDRPLRFRQLLGRFVDVCQTIHYAHSRGVLHRDLKPSNIMLGDYGETLVVDWGLAKASSVGAGSTEETIDVAAVQLSGRTPADMTAAGRVIGTPIYMSPEQASGRQDLFGVTTDVYCLGATLYHLLTGEPPFDPANANVLGEVRTGAFPAPRDRAPGTPRPLSAICQRAMATKPTDRYPTAGELGLEVERWLADEPVAAYPEGVATRLWRWVRGHRTLVLSGMTAATVAVAALSLGVVLLGSANQKITAAKNQADANLKEAVAQRERAQENAALARQAVQDYFVRVSEETLLSQPGMQPLRNDLLQQALNYYQGFLSESADDPGLRGEVAAAYYYVGKITELVDDPAQALPHYQRAVDLQAPLAEASDHDAADWARTLNAMGRAHQKLQQPDDAYDCYERAIDIRRRLAEQDPDSSERARELASSVMNVGLLFAAHGDRQQALEQLRHAQNLREAHLADSADSADADPRLLRDAGAGALNTGLVLLQMQRPDEAADELRKALVPFQAARDADPGDVDAHARMATCRRVLADIYAAQGDSKAAVEQYRRAAELTTELVIRNPEAPAYRIDLAGVRMNLGDLLQASGDLEGALAELRSAIELLDAAPEESPTPRQRRDLGVAQREAGRLEVMLDRAADGLALLRASRQTLRVLVREHPGQQEYSSELSKTNEALTEANRLVEQPPAEKST